MEFEKMAAEKRYSCRSFEQRPIEKTDMDKILETGRIAPTAANAQPHPVHWKRKDLNETVVYESF